jgi:hypothetical protein
MFETQPGEANPYETQPGSMPVPQEFSEQPDYEGPALKPEVDEVIEMAAGPSDIPPETDEEARASAKQALEDMDKLVN